ncbi:MAG: N-6 DNA methylase [bacterium]
MMEKNFNYDALVKGFESNHVFCHMHPYELYRKWLEAVWAFLNAITDKQGFRDCLDNYSRAEGEEFGRLLVLYTACVEREPFQDILGQLFMRLDVNSVRAGQYFTPYSIAEMMARMQFDKEQFTRLVEDKGVVTVCDPAVGSGVMLLAFAGVVHESLGRWGTDRLRLYGTDIDLRCVHMCKIQIRMNGLDAFGRMAGILGAMEESVPADALILKPGRQLELPIAAA